MTGPMLLNSTEDAVREMLQGFAAVHRHTGLFNTLDKDIKVICDQTAPKTAVAIISGGGSGHEPAHAGYVGSGMLTAAVCGDTFASPSSAAVLQAIMHCAGPAGCLLIVKNYTGDRLNFGLAAEAAKGEGIPVEMVVVADDCGVDPSSTIAGRRGIAGTVFVHKIAGAAAASGAPLEAVAALARRAAASVATMGAATACCTVPGCEPSGRIPAGHMELALGIHGEPGARQCRLLSNAETVSALLSGLVGGSSCLQGGLQVGQRVALLVNNLGASTTMELYVAAREALAALEEAGIVVERALVGSYMTALDMSGFSLSLLRLDDELLQLLDAPTAAPAWPATVPRPDIKKPLQEVAQVAPERDPVPADSAQAGNSSSSALALKAAVRACAAACIEAEPELTRLDSLVGDGDCGLTFRRGGTAVIEQLDTLLCERPGTTARQLAHCVGRHMGGTSGALYEIMFTAAANSLGGVAAADAAPLDYARALAAGVQAMSKYGGASVGDCTMLDALQPAADAVCQLAEAGASCAEIAGAASAAAAAGAAATAGMRARAGRASYIAPSGAEGVADPGAHAAAAWLAALDAVVCTQ